jgi:hypothetical protein
VGHEAPQVYGGREDHRQVVGTRKPRRANTVSYALEEGIKMDKKKATTNKGQGSQSYGADSPLRACVFHNRELAG